MSINRKLKRGKLKMIFNNTLGIFEFFRRSSRGGWIAHNPFVNRDLTGGPGHHISRIRHWEQS